MKKFVAIILSVLMLFTMVACSNHPNNSSNNSENNSGDTSRTKQVKVYGIYKAEAAYFINEADEIEKTLKKLSEQYDFEYVWHFLNCDMDPEKCLTQFQTAIADDCDIILTCLPDETMSQSVVEMCNEAGVILIGVDDGIIDENRNKIAPWVGIAAYEIGYGAGEWMANYAIENNFLEDESVGLMYLTVNTVTTMIPRTDGEKDGWASKAGNAMSDRTYEVDFDNTNETAFNGAAAVITGHPEITTWLVLPPSERGAIGAGAALEDANLDSTSCIITLGCDEMTGQWEDGNYSVVRAASYFSGRVIGQVAITSAIEKLLNGVEIPMEYATPAVIVTPDNWQDYVLS